MSEATPFLKQKEIQKLIQKLSLEIDKTYSDKKTPLLLVCPLKGSLFFLSDLIRHLKTPALIDFISIESYKKSFHILKDVKLPLKDHHVLIVKEVMNSGRKLLFLKNRLEAENPLSVKIVTLLDKPIERRMDLTPDFFGKSIDDRYLFGYGMDLDEKHRELKDIFQFTQ